jgi:antitoxin VapB
MGDQAVKIGVFSGLAYAAARPSEAPNMNEIRHVKIVLKDGHRAVEIPEEFDFPGDEVIMRKVGDNIIISPRKKLGLFEWLATLEPLDEEFPDVDEDVRVEVGP